MRERMLALSGHGLSLSNAARGGRRKTKEKIMLKISQSDLRRKSDRQLTGLFNQFYNGVAAYPPSSAERALAASLLAMVTREQALRAFRL